MAVAGVALAAGNATAAAAMSGAAVNATVRRAAPCARAPGGQPSKLSRRHEASQAWRTPGGVRTARASQPRAPRVNPNRAHPPTHHGAAWHATRRSSGCGRHARRFPPPHLGGWLPGSEHARRTAHAHVTPCSGRLAPPDPSVTHPMLC